MFLVEAVTKEKRWMREAACENDNVIASGRNLVPQRTSFIYDVQSAMRDEVVPQISLLVPLIVFAKRAQIQRRIARGEDGQALLCRGTDLIEVSIGLTCACIQPSRTLLAPSQSLSLP